jgi:hypothetical protein
MTDAPRPARRSLPPAAHPAGVVAIAACLWLLYGPGYLGIDAMWSLAWGRDLAHLSTLSASGTTTPHLLSNVLGLVLAPAGGNADRALVTATYLGAAALIWLVAAAARELAGWPAALLAGALMATREQLLYATRSGFLDVLAAGLVAAALLLALRGQPRHRFGGAGALLALAGLLRPEPWVLLAGLAAWRWHAERRLPRRLVGLVVCVPVLWAVGDLILSGDALFSLHETRRVSDLFRAGQGISGGLVEQLVSIPKSLVRAPGPDLFLAGLLTAALLLAPGARGAQARERWLGLGPAEASTLAQLRLALAAAVVLAATLAGEATTGTLLFARFALPFAAIVVALVSVAVVLVARHLASRAPRVLPAAAGVLLLIAAAFLVDARRTTDPERARYEQARAALHPGVPCRPIVVPGLNLRVFVAVWTGERADAVRVAAGQLLPVRGTFVDAASPEAEQFALDPSFPQQRLAGVAAAPVRDTNGWIIRARCSR